MKIDKLISDILVGKTLISVQYNDYDDVEYYKSIGVTPAILPSKIKSVSVRGNRYTDVIVKIILENETVVEAYTDEELTFKE
jgi:hypothetical protein